MKKVGAALAAAAVALIVAACGGSSHSHSNVIPPLTPATSATQAASTTPSAAAWEGGCPPVSAISESTGVAVRKIQVINDSDAAEPGETYCVGTGFPPKSNTGVYAGAGAALEIFYGSPSSLLNTLPQTPRTQGDTSFQKACATIAATGGNGGEDCADTEREGVGYVVYAENCRFQPQSVLNAILKTLK